MSLRNTSKTVAAIRKAVVPHPTVKAPWQWGVVDSFTTTPPLTCNIYINGTQNLGNPAFLTKNVRYLESFVPYKGAVVLIGHGTGGLVSDRVIIGDLAGQNVPVQGTINEITSVGGTITVTDPSGPVVNLENAGVTQIVAGTDITISPTGGTGVVTINASASGAGYLSLTGAGQTATPGDLTQEGGFTVNDALGAAVTLTSYALSGSNLLAICSNGTDLYVSDANAAMWSVTTAGVPTKYSQAGLGPQDICLGPDSNLWMSQGFYTAIWKATTGGSFTRYNIGSPAGAAQQIGICTGSDGNLWMAGNNKIGATIYPGVWQVTTAGVGTFYNLLASSPDGPTDICSGPDGNLWVTDQVLGGVWKVTTAGVGTFYALTGGSFTAAPFGICVGPDSNLWVSDAGNGAVWKVTTAGTPTYYPLGALNPYGLGICAGPDGNLWMADSGLNLGLGYGYVWKITTAGVGTAYLLAGSEPWDICLGPDNNLWVTDPGNSSVWKVTVGAMGFVVNNSGGGQVQLNQAGSAGIQINNTGSGGFSLTDTSAVNGVEITESGDGGIYIVNQGTGGAQFVNQSPTGSVGIVDNGYGIGLTANGVNGIELQITTGTGILEFVPGTSGVSWFDPISGDYCTFIVSAVNPSGITTGNQYGFCFCLTGPHIYVTTNFGGTWTVLA